MYYTNAKWIYQTVIIILIFPVYTETDMTPMSPLKDDDQSDLEWESYEESSEEEEELE